MGIASIRNIDYVVLLCEDMVRARKFYLEVMKFRLERETPRWVSFHVGSGLLCLRPRTLEGVFQDGPGAPGSASVQLAFRVSPPEIDECQAELIAQGVEMLGPPRDIPAWGHRAIFFRDSEGNVIEVYAEV
ncbi:MAG: glyoxalase/bleomycin resistance/dioxygenase family protein [Reyranella sp.]|uniref:VOC family protein n=1 Tax=Reyranella sp. TaxID=1929291 RepID=UPI00121736F3|nr:VOC family protein [Reyranella sp.]TAJ41516.1 MAG: glyoxalase/bleomycin resistance/dioxygenase family protein [Reyranella sp.]